jgi:hypothetical protein
VFCSVEARWFFVGRPSADDVASFLGREEVAEEHRSDLYLPFRGNDSVGLKLRELGSGRAALELKVRTTPPTLLQFRDGQQGHAAAWVKWSSPAPTVSAGAPITTSAKELWLRVEKARRLRKVAVSDRSFREVSASSRVPEGCTYELATLRLDGAEWWTVALEAFGAPESLESRMRQAGDWFFARYPPRRALSSRDSWAYPTWLARVDHGPAGP